MLNCEQTGILVLGGGLAGAAAAIELARAGREVTLVERELTPRHKVCGEFLSTEALQLLRGLGIHPEAHGAHAIHSVVLASARRATRAELPFAARSLTRRCLDDVLLQAAQNAGAHVLRGLTVEALSRQQNQWHAHLSDGRTVAAPQTILATGKHDLRGFPRPQGPQGDLVALKMYLRLTPDQTAALANTVELLLHPHGYTGLQLVEDGHANLTALVRRHHLGTLGGWTGLLHELTATNQHAAQRLQHAHPLLEKPLAISSIPYGFVRKHALAPALFCVGDQAAVIPSFTGDGMSIAVYTGITAAQSVLAVDSAEVFQRSLHRTLSWQVRRATALSRALVHPATSALVATAAHFWPGLIEISARATRIPLPALTMQT